MPKIERTEPETRSWRELVDRLRAEWDSPGDADGAPVIVLEEGPGTPQPLRVNVVWLAWDKLSLSDRTDIILQAMKEADSVEPEDLLRVAVVRGWTPIEAKAYEFDYTTAG